MNDSQETDKRVQLVYLNYILPKIVEVKVFIVYTCIIH